MQGLNKVFLMGRIGNDPEMQNSQNGGKYSRLRVATSRFRRDPEGGESREDTMWHTVFVWGKQGELCSQYLKKGAPVLVEGYLSTYSTANEEGERQWKSLVTAERVDFLRQRQQEGSEHKLDS